MSDASFITKLHRDIREAKKSVEEPWRRRTNPAVFARADGYLAGLEHALELFMGTKE